MLNISLKVSCGIDATIVASLYLPVALSNDTPFLCLYPGGGYSRHYFDLPERGYSQAVAHVAAGFAVATFDHLGVGESTIPAPGEGKLPLVADANHAALQKLLELLANGEVEGVAQPYQPRTIIGVGQSMGGFILLTMQMRHHGFHGIVSLGSSAVETQFPLRGPAPETLRSSHADAQARSASAVAEIDWRWAFHYVEEANALVDQDIAAGLPGRHAPLPWASSTIPDLSSDLMMPGIVSQAAALIDVPVLLVIAERDVCQNPFFEAAAYRRSPDIAIYQPKRMAHMHNFAPTRAALWKRVENFASMIAQV